MLLNTFEIFITVISCLVLLIMAKRWKYYKLHYQIGGPIGLPLLGILHKLVKSEEILNCFVEYAKSYGGMFVVWLGPIPTVMVSEPSIIQEILTSPYCINKSHYYKAIDDVIGPGLLTLRDPTWSLHRKLINPAFCHKILMTFFSIFNAESNKLLEIFEHYSNKEDLDYIGTFKKFTLNIAVQTTMGKSIMNDYHNEGELLNSYQSTIEHTTKMALIPWHRIKIIRQLLGTEKEYVECKLNIHRFVRDLINKNNYIQANDEDNKHNKNIFLNITMEQHKKGTFSLNDVEGESNVIVVAAFETTANTIAYTLLMLAMHPEYQEQAFDEILSLFPNKGCLDVSYEAITQMVYMDMIVNETMRVMAPIPLVGREPSIDLKLSNGIVIPKGIPIGINIFMLHRNKEIWGPDAHSFNPEHFLPANISDKHPYAFIPFTKGTRNCIGWRYGLLVVKMALAKLLRNYRFTTDAKLEDLIFVENSTIKLKNYPQIKFIKRI